MQRLDENKRLRERITAFVIFAATLLIVRAVVLIWLWSGQGFFVNLPADYHDAPPKDWPATLYMPVIGRIL